MGDNAIHYTGHVKMMAAVQPFISGAISKTVNMPEDVNVEDIEQLHVDAWKMGLKAIAIYRDNCKVAQPLSMAKKDGAAKDEPISVAVSATAAAAPADVEVTPAADATGAGLVTDKFILKGTVRRKLPKSRNAKTIAFNVAGSKGYVTVGEFEDGTPGEVFMKIAKQGSTLAGVMDSLAISVSYGLQYGVPLKSYVHGLTSMAFAPNGITDDPEIRTATSLVDYIFRRLALTYLSFDDLLELGMASIDDMPDPGQTSLLEQSKPNLEQQEAKIINDKAQAKLEKVTKTVAEAVSAKPAAIVKKDDTAPICYNCGNQTQRAGSCYVCTSCGSTTGCS
jgi:ribonucleoside-diphosphate reductase alpha chain